MSILGNILGGIAKPVVDAVAAHQVAKAEIKKQKLENEKALQEATNAAIREGRSLDNLWELESLKNSGWKDEFWTLLFATPVFLCFVPFAAPYMQQGFEIVSTLPVWYRWLLIMIVASAFGIRVWRRL